MKDFVQREAKILKGKFLDIFICDKNIYFDEYLLSGRGFKMVYWVQFIEILRERNENLRVLGRR